MVGQVGDDTRRGLVGLGRGDGDDVPAVAPGRRGLHEGGQALPDRGRAVLQRAADGHGGAGMGGHGGQQRRQSEQRTEKQLLKHGRDGVTAAEQPAPADLRPSDTHLSHRDRHAITLWWRR
jgi:hypothetical protein